MGLEQQFLWVYPKEDATWLNKVVKEFNINPVTAQVLLSRGFTLLNDINNYLYGKLPNLFDPNLFGDMEKAVKRIYKAIKNEEKILIYGDNDVDGMTSTALLVNFLKKIGGTVVFFIPNNMQQKKSLLIDSFDYAKSIGCTLLITVDCGITAEKEVKQLIENGIDVIITDHHEPTFALPKCCAILNPKLQNEKYENKDIVGVGVAFKLIHAVTNFLIEKNDIKKSFIDLKNYLDLVALGTISDMGALLGENRILVKYGLSQIKKNKRVGLSKLFQICELNPHRILPIEIASKVAPRLNSIGRIADPKKGVELLLVKNENVAAHIAKDLEICNFERQKIEKVASEEIERYLIDHQEILNNNAIVLYSKNWHPGIIPIVAARLTKKYNRPTMLIALDNGFGKGSIRTIPEFPILSILKDNADLLINFGGHDFAAGLTIDVKNIETLKNNFIKVANDTLKHNDIISKLYVDASINFNEITFDFMESLSLLEPFGTENPSPILYCDVKQLWPPKVVGKSHLKFYLEQNDRILEGIGFGMADRRKFLLKNNVTLRIAFTPHVNTFLDKTSIQLQIKDFILLDEQNNDVKSEENISSSKNSKNKYRKKNFSKHKSNNKK